MTYIPQDRFIQIALAAPPTQTQLRQEQHDLLYALDEGGQVWYFEFNNRVWVPLPRDRAKIAEGEGA